MKATAFFGKKTDLSVPSEIGLMRNFDELLVHHPEQQGLRNGPLQDIMRRPKRRRVRQLGHHQPDSRRFSEMHQPLHRRCPANARIVSRQSRHDRIVVQSNVDTIHQIRRKYPALQKSRGFSGKIFKMVVLKGRPARCHICEIFEVPGCMFSGFGSALIFCNSVQILVGKTRGFSGRGFEGSKNSKKLPLSRDFLTQIGENSGTFSGEKWIFPTR